jgi:hypothetical protein
MKWSVFVLAVCLYGPGTSKAQELTLLPDAPKPQPGIIDGTVIDVNNDTVPGDTVVHGHLNLKIKQLNITKNGARYVRRQPQILEQSA